MQGVLPPRISAKCPVCRARFPAGDLKVSVRLRDLVQRTIPSGVDGAPDESDASMDCCICLERLRDPVTLPCGHDGCLACLNTLPTTRGYGQRSPHVEILQHPVDPVPRMIFNIEPRRMGSPRMGRFVPDLRRRILNPATGRMVLDTAANRRRAGRSPSPAAELSPAAALFGPRGHRWQVQASHGP
jgi:hypothetical protein